MGETGALTEILMDIWVHSKGEAVKETELLWGNSRRESALPFRGPRKIGPAVPTLTLARRTRRNPSFRPPGPVRVASPTLLSHGEVIESVGGGVRTT